jgi:hypothetical protein
MDYLGSLAELIKKRVSVDTLPEYEISSPFRIYALLAITKEGVVSPEEVHDAWAAWMGEINPYHHLLVPFSCLDTTTQQADEPYVAAIKEAWVEWCLLHKNKTDKAK